MKHETTYDDGKLRRIQERFSIQLLRFNVVKTHLRKTFKHVWWKIMVQEQRSLDYCK